MSVEIKVASVEPIRPTFDRTARRFGTARPANRYQEASFDLQPMENFHYRPMWDPEHEIYDARRTAVVMADWDSFADPRQFYYATYVTNRARLQETTEKNFDFVEKRQLMTTLGEARLKEIEETLLPLRHLEWAGNLNNCFITAYCFGSAMAQGAMYCTTDHLGIAQYLSRIGLLIDHNTGSSLDAAKQRWMTDPNWQAVRKLCEDMMVEKDWFEVFVAQNLVIDALVHKTFYARYHQPGGEPSLAFVGMLTDFMNNWYGDISKWVDACIKKAAAESEENRALIETWVDKWLPRVGESLSPVLVRFVDGDGEALLQQATDALETRLSKLNVRTA